MGEFSPLRAGVVFLAVFDALLATLLVGNVMANPDYVVLGARAQPVNAADTFMTVLIFVVLHAVGLGVAALRMRP